MATRVDATANLLTRELQPKQYLQILSLYHINANIRDPFELVRFFVTVYLSLSFCLLVNILQAWYFTDDHGPNNVNTVATESKKRRRSMLYVYGSRIGPNGLRTQFEGNRPSHSWSRIRQIWLPRFECKRPPSQTGQDGRARFVWRSRWLT